ncbi:MAG: oxaloacetate decarboxylase [Acetobacteraceae bacterium]
MTTLTSQLRARLREPGMIVAPGAYDGLTAMLVAQAGFSAVYMTGAGTSVAHGYPDFGLLTETEMVANAARMARAVDIPLIADADTGYGNELNVVRTVRDYEQAGVAGLHIEDQVSPKRCGHLDDKEIVPREDWLAKIRAAASARRDPDFLVIARTDSRAVVGFEEAITRAKLALQAGADMAFVEAPRTMEEIAAVPTLVKGPCLLNVVWGGKTPEIDLRDAERMGYKLAILPGLLFKAAIGACDAALAAVKETHRQPAPAGGMPVQDAFHRVGAGEWGALRTKVRTEAESQRAAE